MLVHFYLVMSKNWVTPWPPLIFLFLHELSTRLGGGFKHFLFLHLPGEMIQFD